MQGGRPGSTAAEMNSPQIPAKCLGRFHSDCERGLGLRIAQVQRKCTEPVTPSSGFPTDRRRSDCLSESHQPRTLRTRCMHDSRVPPRYRQGHRIATIRNLRSFLFTQGFVAVRATCSDGQLRRKTAGPGGPAARFRRAGNAFVHLPDRPSAFAYSCSGGFVLPAPRARRRQEST
jgi:hypothetical protein